MQRSGRRSPLTLSQRRRGGRQNQIDRCEAPRCDRVVVTNVGVCHYLQVARPVQTIAMRRMTAMVALRTTNLGIAMVGQAAIRRERNKAPSSLFGLLEKEKKKAKSRERQCFGRRKSTSGIPLPPHSSRYPSLFGNALIGRSANKACFSKDTHF